MDTKLVMVRSLYSAIFKNYVLTGPSALDVYRQMQKVSSSEMIASNSIVTAEYWHLGVHVCNEHESNLTLAIADVELMLEHQLPFDSHCIQDALFWLGNDEAPTAEVLATIEELQQRGGKKFVASVIPFPIDGTEGFKAAEEVKLLLQKGDGTYVGSALGKSVAYVDYTADENIVAPWLKLAAKAVPASADGFFVQGAWMLDESVGGKVPTSNAETLPYIPEYLDTAMAHLPPWDVFSLLNEQTAPHELYLHRHNLFVANLMTRFCGTLATANQMCLSSVPTSIYPGVVAKTASSWYNFARQIQQAVTASISGIKWYGVPVCGSDEYRAVQEDLCVRWYQFASLLPLFKVNSARFVHQFSKHVQGLLTDAIER